MAFAVMCCGCQRLMDEEGKASIGFFYYGLVVTGLPNKTIDAEFVEATNFPDKESADAAALKAGRPFPGVVEHRRAYIEIPD